MTDDPLEQEGSAVSREDVVAICTRLFAIFLALVAVRSGVQAAVQNIGQIDRVIWLLAESALPLAVAILLWLFPLTVARKLLPVMRTDRTPISSEGTPLIEIGCTLLGLWLLAAAISDAVYWSAYLFLAFRLGDVHAISPESKGAIIATVVELAVALWLLLGYNGILGAIRRFRVAGVRS